MVPERLIDLIELIGVGPTFELLKTFGGTRLYVSTDPTAAGTLAEAIGASAAKTMCTRYAGMTIEIPAGHGFLARHYRHCGMNHAAIAARLGITQARVAEMLD